MYLTSMPNFEEMNARRSPVDFRRILLFGFTFFLSVVVGIASMRRVSEYENHAAECCQMALRVRDEVHKKQLEDMAELDNAGARTQKTTGQAGGALD